MGASMPKNQPETSPLHELNNQLASNLVDTRTMENRQRHFQDELVSYLGNLNKFWYYLYMFMACILVTLWIYKKVFTYVVLIGISVVLLLYPFVIDYMEYYIYRFFSYIYSLIMGRVYVYV